MVDWVMKKEAPYDAIHVGAAAPNTPHELIKQLKVGGRLVAPVGVSIQSMVIYDKLPNGEIKTTEEMGVRYVPLTDAAKQYASAGIKHHDDL